MDRPEACPTSERKDLGRRRETFYVLMTGEAAGVCDLTRSVYQLIQRGAELEDKLPAEVRMVRSVGGFRGRDFEDSRAIEGQRPALQLVDQLAVGDEELPLFEARLEDPEQLTAAALDQDLGQLAREANVGFLPLRGTVRDPLLFP